MEPIKMRFDDVFKNTTCSVYIYGNNTESESIVWHPQLPSRILVNIFAVIFLALFCFGAYIFVKYLVIRSQAKRVSMIIFYVLTLMNLGLRMTIIIVLNFKTFFATETLVLSTISLMFTIWVGTSHAQILCSLTIDLKTCRC